MQRPRLAGNLAKSKVKDLTLVALVASLFFPDPDDYPDSLAFPRVLRFLALELGIY
jgi:hypothetical protein